MKTVTAPKPMKFKGYTLVIPAPKRNNFLPISIQISLKAQAKRHDKSRTRTKSKRQWQKDA
jgi:hypothetical protein